MGSSWPAVKERVEKSMQQWGVPGAAVGILHGAETVSDGFGVTSVDNPLPVTDETIFKIASISKTFTGTALMRLVDQGKMDLSAKVREYLPEFKVRDPEASANVTIRHLMTHTEGWDGDLSFDAGRGDDALQKYAAALADREQIAPVGTVFAYNNSGFGVAGAAMEKVTGKRFEDIIKELVFDPLGMKQSFLDATDVMTHRFAVGHTITSDGAKVVHRWAGSRGGLPAGGIASTVKDMLKYARFHLGDGETIEGERILSTESMALLHTPQVTIRGKEGQAIAFHVDDSFGPRQFDHGGRSPEQNSLLTIVPDHDFAIIVMNNGDVGHQVTKEVTRFVIKQYLGIEMKDPELIPATEEDYHDFVCKYAAESAYGEVAVLAGQLVLQHVATPGGPFPAFSLGLVGKDCAIITDGPWKNIVPFELVRDADGTVNVVRVGLRIFRKV